MDPWHQFWIQFLFQLSSILPWFAAGTAAVVTVSLTPFGRALTRYLRDARSRALPADAQGDLTALRTDIAEVLERLEFLERAIAQQRQQLEDASARPKAPLPPGGSATEARIPTPV